MSLGKTFARFVAIVVGALSLTLVGSMAFADDPPFGGEVGGGGDNHGDDGGGGGIGGGKPTNPPPTRNVYASFSRQGSSLGCPDSAIGYRLSYRSTTEHFASNSALYNFISNYTASELPGYITAINGTQPKCIYPPSHRDITVKVMLDADIRIEKVIPDSKVLRTAKAVTRWGNGEKTLNSALASDTAYASVYSNISELGRYRVSGVARAQYVTYRTYSSATDVFGNQYPDEIINIGNVFNDAVTNARGELTCDGWRNSWSSGSNSWSWVDCGPTETSTPIYQCVQDAGPAVTVNGISGSATLFRSGEPAPVKFSAVRPTGLTNLGAERTRWVRDNNSTPWRENGVSVRDANFRLSTTPNGSQLFTSNTSTGWHSGIITDLYARGFWSSTDGSPTRVTPSYSYQGTARIKSVRVTGVDSNGNWETETTYQNVRAMAVCDGRPLVVDYVRSTQGNNLVK